MSQERCVQCGGKKIKDNKCTVCFAAVNGDDTALTGDAERLPDGKIKVGANGGEWSITKTLSEPDFLDSIKRLPMQSGQVLTADPDSPNSVKWANADAVRPIPERQAVIRMPYLKPGEQVVIENKSAGTIFVQGYSEAFFLEAGEKRAIEGRAKPEDGEKRLDYFPFKEEKTR